MWDRRVGMRICCGSAGTSLPRFSCTTRLCLPAAGGGRQPACVVRLTRRPPHSPAHLCHLMCRQLAAGDRLRVMYDGLSKDPNSLSNLDQDLPNYAQVGGWGGVGGDHRATQGRRAGFDHGGMRWLAGWLAGRCSTNPVALPSLPSSLPARRHCSLPCPSSACHRSGCGARRGVATRLACRCGSRCCWCCRAASGLPPMVRWRR